MQKISLELNLARKLRPRTFDEIIGQDLSVRILKNGLYLKKLFPVYIFSGQRGCGKTTTARILAAAVNCERLSDFQTDPKRQVVPCLDCFSCRSMVNLNHPDFIEMDAASHTGVDNVRQILDSAAHIPLIGSRKIYLIDEVHMLSKAAFNAFLKILEEPPSSVLFILATTELYKIPETVRSRGFQLFFNSVNFENLKNHLSEICRKENIVIDDGALDLLVGEAEGSVRDLINLLERVRLASGRVSEDVVLKILGKISYTELFELWGILLEKNPEKLFVYLTKISFEKISPQSLWDMLIILCRSLLWLKYGVIELSGLLGRHLEVLKGLSEKCSTERLNSILQIFWSQEVAFLRTNKKSLFLETVLLQICRQVNIVDLEELIKNCSSNGNSEQGLLENIQEPKIVSTNKVDNRLLNIQGLVLKKIAPLRDPLLTSIFKQTRILSFDRENKLISLKLVNDREFFRDKIKECAPRIMPLLGEIFPGCVGFVFCSDVNLQENKSLPGNNHGVSSGDNYSKTCFSDKVPEKMLNITTVDSISISDRNKWTKANLLAQFFSGRIEKVR